MSKNYQTQGIDSRNYKQLNPTNYNEEQQQNSERDEQLEYEHEDDQRSQQQNLQAYKKKHKNVLIEQRSHNLKRILGQQSGEVDRQSVSNKQKINRLHERLRTLNQGGDIINEMSNMSNNKGNNLTNNKQKHEEQNYKMRNKGISQIKNLIIQEEQHDINTGMIDINSNVIISSKFQNNSNPIQVLSPKAQFMNNQKGQNINKNNKELNNFNNSMNPNPQPDSREINPNFIVNQKNYQSQLSYQSNNNIQNNYNIHGNSSLYCLQVKYLHIEDKFFKFKLSEEQLLKNIQNQISELQQSSKYLKKQLEKFNIKNDQILEQAEGYMNTEILQLNEEMKELKKGAIDSIDNKYKAIKTQTIALISQQFQQQYQQANAQVKSCMQKVKCKLQKQANCRDQTAQFLISSFSEQMIKLQESISHQRELRIAKNDELLRLICSIDDGLSGEILKEKRQMMETIQAMENMLEDVCYKIQERIIGAV